jgi:hypothetical protein
VQRGASAAAIKSAYRSSPEASSRRQQERSEGCRTLSEINSAMKSLATRTSASNSTGEIDAEGKPRSRAFPGRRPAGRAGPGGFETYTFRTGGGRAARVAAPVSRTSSTACSVVPRAAPAARAARRPFEFESGGIGLDLDLSVAMTVSLKSQ